nr:unnamed protein product [Callosobruchus analis]
MQEGEEPFNGAPPPELEPLRDIVQIKYYEEVMVGETMTTWTGWRKRRTSKEECTVWFYSSVPVFQEYAHTKRWRHLLLISF